MTDLCRDARRQALAKILSLHIRDPDIFFKHFTDKFMKSDTVKQACQVHYIKSAGMQRFMAIAMFILADPNNPAVFDYISQHIKTFDHAIVLAEVIKPTMPLTTVHDLLRLCRNDEVYDDIIHFKQPDTMVLFLYLSLKLKDLCKGRESQWVKIYPSVAMAYSDTVPQIPSELTTPCAVLLALLIHDNKTSSHISWAIHPDCYIIFTFAKNFITKRFLALPSNNMTFAMDNYLEHERYHHFIPRFKSIDITRLLADMTLANPTMS